MPHALKLDFGAFAAPARGVLVVFCNDGANFGVATRRALGRSAGLGARGARAGRFSGKDGSVLELILPEGLKVGRLVVIGAGKSAVLKQKDLLKLGGLAMSKLPTATKEATVFAALPGGPMRAEQAADLALGIALRDYAFDHHKTKRKDDEKPPIKRTVTVAAADISASRGAYTRRYPVNAGVQMARDLVNDPAKVLYPEEFARRT